MTTTTYRTSSFFDTTDYPSATTLAGKVDKDGNPVVRKAPEVSAEIMRKKIETLDIHEARKRLAHEDYRLHELEHLNHKVYMNYGKKWTGHTQGVKLWKIRDHVVQKVSEAKHTYAEEHDKAKMPRKEWKVGIAKAGNNLRVHVEDDIDEINTKVQGYYDTLELPKKFKNKVPEKGEDHHYRAKDVCNWVFRALRQVMLVADHYVTEHKTDEDENMGYYQTTVKSNETREHIRALRKRIKKLKKAHEHPHGHMPAGGVHLVPAVAIDGYGRVVSGGSYQHSGRHHSRHHK